MATGNASRRLLIAILIGRPSSRTWSGDCISKRIGRHWLLTAALKVAMTRREKRRRAADWKEKLAASDLRELCHILRKPQAPPLCVLRDGEGWTSHPARILELIRQEWAPIMKGAVPERTDIEDYLQALPEEHFDFPAITPQQLRDAVAKMKGKSIPGADG